MNNASYPIDPPAAAYDGSELAIQTLFRSRMRMVAPRVHIVAVPNGTYIASLAGRAKVSREGIAKGFPDCIILWPRGVAFIEFKAKTGSLSESQVEWLGRLHGYGFPTMVARHPDTAIEFIRAAGAPFSGRLAA